MNEQRIFDFFAGKGFTAAGIFGMLGNIRDESGGNPRNLQNSYEKKLGYTDDSYTEAVDAGTYKNFVHDAAGYGLAQWTYSTRKENLLKFARNQGDSIGDFDMQLAFMYQELRGYKTLFAILTTTDSIREASDAFMTQYERPADQSEKAKRRRASYGEEICAMLTGVENPDSMVQITEAEARQRVISIAVSWYGKKEADGSHRSIIDLYNGHTPLARGYKVKYTDAWCATYGSAVAIAAGYADIIPTECGCGQMIAAFRAMNRWVENDAYIPSPGDYIFYDWDDTGAGDCTGWPEHVGIVVSVFGDVIKVIEGNKDDAVGYREIKVNGRYIRGYGVPDYGAKVVSKTPENVTKPPQNVITSPENVSEPAKTGALCMTPQWVGVVTADTLNVRTWAGEEYSNIKSWPKLAEGNMVEVCDSIKAADGSTWYYIRIDGRIYGFSHSDYIKEASGSAAPAEIKKGDVVQFTGGRHYTSSYAKATGKACKPGLAKVTAVNPGSSHPYHLVAVSGCGSTVYGWTDAEDVKI